MSLFFAYSTAELRLLLKTKMSIVDPARTHTHTLAADCHLVLSLFLIHEHSTLTGTAISYPPCTQLELALEVLSLLFVPQSRPLEDIEVSLCIMALNQQCALCDTMCTPTVSE